MQAAQLFFYIAVGIVLKKASMEATDWIILGGLNLYHENEDQERIAHCFMLLGKYCQQMEKYSEAIAYYEECLNIYIEKKSHEGIACCNKLLGDSYFNLKNYSEAVSKYEHSLSTIISHNLDNCKQLEGHVCHNLGNFLIYLNRYQESKQYLDRALIIAKEIGDRTLELKCNGNLSLISGVLCEYKKAVDYANQALSIANVIDSRVLKHFAYNVLGDALLKIGRAKEAIEYFNRYLQFAKETGSKSIEINALCSLSSCYNDFDYDSAIRFAEECLTIAKETGDMESAYWALSTIGSVLAKKGQVKEAIDYYNKCLQYAIHFNDKDVQARVNTNLGMAYVALCKHYKAIEHFQTILKLHSELGIETLSYEAYNNLGALYDNIGNYQQAAKYLELCIVLKEGNKLATVYINLSDVYSRMNELQLSREYLLKGIIIGIRTEDKESKILYFQELGNSFCRNTNSYKAMFFHKKALKSAQDTQNSQLIGICYTSIAKACHHIGQIDNSIGYHERALITFADSGDVQSKGQCLFQIACLYKLLVKQNAINCNFITKSEKYFREALQCYEAIFADLREKHDLKITIVDTYIKAYKELALLLIETGRSNEAMLVCDRGRACTLGDTLASRYEMQHYVSEFTYRKPLEEKDLQNILSSKRSLLFLAILEDNVHSWILSQNSSLKYVQNESNANTVLPNVAEIIDYIITQPASDKSLQSSLEKLLKKLFQHLITPIKDYLIEDEVVIVPEHNLYMVPFAALQDPQTGLYFCESKQIRIMPSLTTMKILQQCPPDYHCSEDALVVGNPSVDEVIFRGERMIFPSLEEAEREACVFASILGVKPVTGTSATKDAVKEKLKEGAAVIHIAAHGDDTTGEIILAPGVSAQTKAIPEEEDYILTMQEVQDIGVRAKLVVLSCCHSGRGEIHAEGVIGMARAFLAAGARAVVASLWTISDQATLNFMSGFYYHLRIGESASKSLNESMKELIREKTYSHPKYWAPFVLIGDDVTIF